MKLPIALSCVLLCAAASAQPAGAQAASNAFVEALITGRGQALFPESPAFASVREALNRQTGDAGPIVVKTERVARFASQPHCGRVAYVVAQPSSHTVWPNLGGQLNLCEDGLPPLRQCHGRPGTLVPPTRPCADGSTPEDTPEVAAAIRASFERGYISADEARRRTHAPAPSASGARP